MKKYGIVWLIVALLLAVSPATATTVVLPNVLTNGTPADANQVMANFNALASGVNNIDNTNIGSSGIYASQIIPTTAAQATFGGTTVGYTFVAPAVGITPLTVTGIAGQTARIFNVTAPAGLGGGFGVNSNGEAIESSNLRFGSAGFALAAGVVGIQGDTGTPQGMTFNVAAAPANGYQWFAGGTAGTKLAQLGSPTLPTLTVSLNAGGGDAFDFNATGAYGGNLASFQNNGTAAFTINSTGGVIGTSGASFASSVQAADSIGAAKAFVPPIYTAAGAALASTTHIVQGQGTTNSSGTLAISLTGAAQFTSGSSYSVTAFAVNSGTAFGIAAINATGFTLQSSVVAAQTVFWIAVGS